MLRELPVRSDPRVLAGLNLADDAGIYRLTDEIALVQSIDFFTPVVDDPYTFGAIAAANAFSDIYAVGGTPVTALNVAVFPVQTIPVEALGAVLRGGSEKAAEAGVSIVGGHTVDGEEPMYGLAVTGTVQPERMVGSSGGRHGDVLVLSKPLGTGLIATALKAGMARSSDVESSIAWMMRLNRSASEAMLKARAHASTDITGFGLLGHLHEMAKASGLSAELTSATVPLLPDAERYAERGFLSAGGHTNQEYVQEFVSFESTVSEAMQAVLVDPQTSGGLLMAVDEPRVDRLRADLSSTGNQAALVGHLVEGPAGSIAVS